MQASTKHTRKTRQTRREPLTPIAPIPGNNADWLVDAGSTILSRSVWKQMGGGKKQLTPVGAQQNLVDAQGSPLKLAGVGAVDLQLGTRMFEVDVLIVETLTEDLILGRDFLKQHKCSVELGEQNLLQLTEAGITVALGCSTRQQKKASVATVTRQPSKRRKEAPRETEEAFHPGTGESRLAVVAERHIPLRPRKPAAQERIKRSAKKYTTGKRDLVLSQQHEYRVNVGDTGGSLRFRHDGRRLRRGKQKNNWRKMESKYRPPDVHGD